MNRERRENALRALESKACFFFAPFRVFRGSIFSGFALFPPLPQTGVMAHPMDRYFAPPEGRIFACFP
ncbi:MAG TPA: hypothetical protein VJ528_08150, partial [Geothrix sp.]|nr:hypothetical protein [Geothrix sp.]